MAIRVACPSCQRQYQLADDLAGKKIRCKSCNAVFKTPGNKAAAPLPPAEHNAGPLPHEGLQAKPTVVKPPVVAGPELRSDTTPRQPTVTKKSKGWLMVALLGCGGLALLLVLGAGGIAAYFFFGLKTGNAPPKAVALADKTREKPAEEKDLAKDKEKEQPAAKAKEPDLHQKNAPATPKDDFNLKEARKSVVHIKSIAPGLPTASGSGFLVSKEGLVYTNRHVVQPSAPLQGHMLLVGVPSRQNPDELEYFKADMVYLAPPRDELDFALLKITARPGYGDFPVLPLSYTKLALAAPVAAVGYPVAIKAETGTLSFNQGRISAVEVVIDKKPYYQTDAAINPGNSGGPLINAHGEAVGIVTLRKNNANNMGFALYLTEVKKAVDTIPAQRIADSRPPAGPMDLKELPKPTGIEPTNDAWNVTEGRLVEKKGHCILDNDGGTFCITSKEDLPENFQISMTCANDFFKGKMNVQASQKTFLGMLSIRIGTDDTSKSIMERNNGYLIQLTINKMLMWRADKTLDNKNQGTPPDVFLLTVTRQGGLITVAIDGEIVMRGTDPSPIPGRHKLSIGGFLSKVLLGEVVITPLEGAPIVAKEIPKAKEPPKKPVPNPKKSAPLPEERADRQVVKLPAPIRDLVVGGGGRFLVLDQPNLKRLAIFDTFKRQIVHAVNVNDDSVRFAAGQDHLMLLYPKTNVLQRYNFKDFERDKSDTLTLQSEVHDVVMGSASRGPLILCAKNLAYVDIDTFQLLPFQLINLKQQSAFKDNKFTARVSADGHLLTAWRGTSPQGLHLIDRQGDTVTYVYEHQTGGSLVPNFDGSIIHTTKLGLVTPAGKVIDSTNQGPRMCTIPAHHPDYLIAIPAGNIREKTNTAGIEIYLRDDARPICRLQHIDEHRKDFNSRGGRPLTVDQRIHFIPDAKVIITVPVTNDELVLYDFDIDAALEASGLEYFVITSRPPVSAGRGEAFTYQLAAKSRTGGPITAKLDAGPTGMTVTPEGKVTWSVPADLAAADVAVVITVRNSSGQEVFHSFKIRVTGLAGKT